MEKGKNKFASGIGFILSAAGSAVGLGNLWAFPYKASKNGGAEFVLVYIMCVIFLGFVAMLCELHIGRRAKANPVTAFKMIISVCVFDTVIALLAGICIFPAVAHFDPQLLDSSKGVVLIFIILPEVFESLGAAGRIISFLFFMMVCIAAVTSVVSLIEVVTQFVIQKHNVSRKKSALIVGILCFIVSIPVGISLGHTAIKEDGYLSVFGMDMLTFMDEMTNTILMPVCALFSCIAIGWILKPERVLDELAKENTVFSPFFRKVFSIMVKFVTPVLILLVEIGGIKSEIDAGAIAVLVAAGIYMALGIAVYFAFSFNKETGNNDSE